MKLKIFLGLLGILPALCLGQAQSYHVAAFAGTGTASYSGDGGQAASATLNFPLGLAYSNGTLYIADQINQVVRCVSTLNGTISTIAGSNIAGFSGDGADAKKARLQNPTAVVVSINGAIYVADSGNHVVRVVNSNTLITTSAGRFENSVYSGDGGTAVNAGIAFPYGLAIDANGNLYIADSANNRIRKVAIDGTISTVAGVGLGDFGGDGGPAKQALLNHPDGLALDAAGNLYIADTLNHRIRKMAKDGTITTVAGNGVAGYSGDGGRATFASFNEPEAIAVDASGNLYITDTLNQRVRRMLPDGTVTTIAGNGVAGFSGDGGAALAAQFKFPRGIAVDPLGKVYVSDNQNGVVRVLTPDSLSTGSGPAINQNGVISASAFGVVAAAAPGSWIEIYGQNLAPGAQAWALADFSGIQAPKLLQGTAVTVGGVAAAVSYVSPGQVNVQVPDIAPGLQPIVVTTAAGASPAFTATINTRQPQLFAPASLNAGGKQYVAAFFSDGSLALPANGFGGAGRRAKAGNILVLYGIGFGAVTPNSPAGQIVQQGNTLIASLQVKVGGVPAVLMYAGLVPGSVGLYQFNVVVPNLVASDAVAVEFTVGGTPGGQALFTAVGN